MVRDAEMAFHHQKHRNMSQDPPQKALPCWKLNRPAKALGRKSSLLDDLAGSPAAPTSADRLFNAGDDACKVRRSSSSVSLMDPWTCSKTASCSAASVSVQDTEAPSPDSRHGGHSEEMDRGDRRRRRGRQREGSERLAHEDHDHDNIDSDLVSSNCFASNSLIDTSVSSSVASSSEQHHSTTTPTPFHVLLLPESGQKRPRAEAQEGIADTATTDGELVEALDEETSNHHHHHQDADRRYPEAPSSLVSSRSDMYMDESEEDCIWEVATTSPDASPLLNATLVSYNDDGGGDGDGSASVDCVGLGWERARTAGCAAAAVGASTGNRTFGAGSGDGSDTGGSFRSDEEKEEEKVVGGDENLLPCDEEDMEMLEEEIDLSSAFRSNNDNNAAAAGSRECDPRGPMRATCDDCSGGQLRLVYDVLVVDRGCGKCDTSLVPLTMEDWDPLSTEKMRAVTAGQGEFLAKRGFAGGLVSHFLRETDVEFKALQGGSSRGMNEAQIQEAELRFTEVFLPAVKGLKRHGSMDVVLDSLFEGEDNAGEFVVRFEVTITRCHPEDLEATSARAIRECAPAIRSAVTHEGVAPGDTHEVVFVGRPMWELVPPVWNFSNRR